MLWGRWVSGGGGGGGVGLVCFSLFNRGSGVSTLVASQFEYW